MMNYHNIASHSGPVPLPSLMYVDCPTPLGPPPQQQRQQQQQDMHHPQTKKRPNKVHVSAACINCKKAHLACDVSRPCNRCVTTDKADTCRDIQHKKRGRPKMMRDANNNKIRPAVSTTTTTPASVTQNMSNNSNRIMCGPNVDFLSMVPAATSNDMMTVFLSMDLCCARVSDKSLEYLELYPQEFGHRSLYDFLVPGENQSTLSKLHRCLLDNAVQHQHQQHQQARLPHDLLRSSSEKFFSYSLDSLLNIANGSLTLKQKLKFKKGRGDAHADYEEMNCRFYLGGAFGADLFDASTFDQLYIVCIASPIVSAININDVIHLPPLMMNNNNNDSCSTVSSPVSPPPAAATAVATTTANTSTTTTTTSPPTEQSSNSPDNQSEQDDDMTGGGDHSGSSTPTTTATATLSHNNNNSEHSQNSNHSNNTIHLPLLSSNSPPPPQQQQQQPGFDNDNNNSKSVLDRFRYNTKTPSQQFIHPNELYYLQTTSSRLSSEAIAHTAYPYLSKTPASAAAVGSGPLANYNSQFKK